MAYNQTTMFTGKITDANRHKHSEAVQASLQDKFDGQPENLNRFLQDLRRRMTVLGMRNEFNVTTDDPKPRPPHIDESTWLVDPTRFQYNLLESYSKVTLAQAQATRQDLIMILDAQPSAPKGTSAEAAQYASRQHRCWIAEFLYNSITSDVRTSLDAYEEEHYDDGILIFLCLMQMYAGSEMHALVVAETALQSALLNLSNFNHDIEKLTAYIRVHVRRIVNCGGFVTNSHWIALYSTLSTSPTEEFRILILQWKRNWLRQSGEGHNWSMMQFLAKVDAEYVRLQRLGQWKTTDENTTIVALQAALRQQASQFASQLAAYKATMPRERGFAPNTATTTTTHPVPAINRNPARNKPDFTPGPNDPLECTIAGVRNLWCAICERWTLTHTTLSHVRRPNRTNSKAPDTATVPPNNTQRAHLAYGTTYDTARFDTEQIDTHEDF
jgi:hypothetical protein